MKFGALDDIAKSFSHALLNEAGGRSGLFFWSYVFLWIALTSYFIVSRLLSLHERTDLIYLASAPIYIILLYVPIYIFWLYEKKIGIEKRRIKEIQLVDTVNAEYKFAEPVETGFNSMLFLRLNNPTEKLIENIWIRAVFPVTVRCDKPVLSLGSLEPMSSLTASLPFVPLTSGTLSMGYYDLYFEIHGHKHQKPPVFLGNIDISYSFLKVDVKIPEPLRLGHSSIITTKIENRSNVNLDKLQIKCFFHRGLSYDTAFSDTKSMAPGSDYSVIYSITPTIESKIDVGHFDILLNIGGNNCKIGPVAFGEYYVQVPNINIKINIPKTLYSEIGNSIGIYVENRSDEMIHNICFNSCFSSFVECHNPGVCIPEVQPYSSGYTSLVIKPANTGKIDLGNLNFSFEVNGALCQQEPIVLGIHGVV
ncbi:hypothetical protein [Methanolobus psychrotolerans]|uniref:hypothetical protein n=1 Tax=Methanolobus psychrotolerans TaxID=1874706 RepID=UPI000B918121|nr:hypothetical protein [Methanolobus psychrotolerans]